MLIEVQSLMDAEQGRKNLGSSFHLVGRAAHGCLVCSLIFGHIQLGRKRNEIVVHKGVLSIS